MRGYVFDNDYYGVPRIGLWVGAVKRENKLWLYYFVGCQENKIVVFRIRSPTTNIFTETTLEVTEPNNAHHPSN